MAKRKSKTISAVKTRARRESLKHSPLKDRSATKPVKRSTPKKKQQGYDAEKYTGAIPGLAERMKEYLKHMRDDR